MGTSGGRRARRINSISSAALGCPLFTTSSKLREKPYGLVISDWNMEPMTGLQLLKEVRADARLKNTPFIMVTAESKTENVVSAKQAGVNNYIVKPFNAETLKSKISAVLGDF